MQDAPRMCAIDIQWDGGSLSVLLSVCSVPKMGHMDQTVSKSQIPNSIAMLESPKHNLLAQVGRPRGRLNGGRRKGRGRFGRVAALPVSGRGSHSLLVALNLWL